MQYFPASYSTLSSSALQNYITRKYDFAVNEIEFISRGVNDVYLVHSPKKNFIFKVYRSEHRSFSQVNAEVALLNELKKNRCKVAYPVIDSSNEFIQKFKVVEGEKYGVMYEFAKGTPSNEISDTQLIILGKEMARNHLVLTDAEYEYDRPEYNIQTTISTPLIQLKSAFKRFNYEEGYAMIRMHAEKAKARLKGCDTIQISKGICHYDYIAKNFRFDEDGQFCLFDFDFAGYGFLVNDIMTFRVHLFFQQLYKNIEDVEAKRQFDLFLEAYQSIRPLSKSELNLIPDLGICFWIFYLSVQYEGFEIFSSTYFNQTYLKNWMNWIDKWEKFTDE